MLKYFAVNKYKSLSITIYNRFVHINLKIPKICAQNLERLNTIEHTEKGFIRF